MKTTEIFDILRSDNRYVATLPFRGKTIPEVSEMLPPTYSVRFASEQSDYQDPREHPDEEQYCVYGANGVTIIHLYVNGGVVDDTLEVYE